MIRHSWFAALGLATALLPAAPALAADHLDGAYVKNDSSTDINDVYAWMSADKSKAYLIMTVFPVANKTTSKFSTAAYYVFHTSSRGAFLGATPTPFDIVCGFDTAQKISCWFGDNSVFVSGDASNTSGLSSADGRIKIFAGPRKDHFFFNLDGFNRARTLVKANAAALNPDGNGCPTAAGPTNTVAAALSQTSAGTTPPTDFFLTLNTLAIVIEVDTALVTKGGKFLGVWAGTHRKG